MQLYLAHFVLALILAPLPLGIIAKVKALFAGRHGKPLLQPYYDIAKLLFKGEVTGEGTTWVFSAGPVIALASAAAALALLPLGGVSSPFAFQGDFILCAYLLGMGRFATVLAALDTGSPFEGMGASREALFGAIAEPVLFLAFLALIGTAGSLGEGSLSLSGLFNGFPVTAWTQGRPELVLLVFVIGVLLLLENCRIPVDDPTTHLELTMIHEVMVLDHSGPNMAFILYGSAVKLWIFSTLLIGLVVPPLPFPLHAAASLCATALVACLVGVVESVMARLRMHVVPALVGLAGSVAAFVLILTLVR
ncbi:MAG TPA: NADH-quinone oxidoreductase subunit H [Mailhella massiliensis]|uniref:NADH-quinone oxidoreductase subunit H n=2 Tax=Mailhella massiliensis TaxID=1903261 RepID=A0A921DQV2_9BACT|nr:NADH-quinone oxidoreductase subunit H [Mailhella massiliensis]HJD96258.1 NADH-quinone oxidoreductase subunit H [Mailhella massiliensis]